MASRPQRKRCRASVACSSCRKRRIKCITSPEQNRCDHCRHGGYECVIQDDDLRRRPISRGYVRSLTDRLQLLENMLGQANIRGAPLPIQASQTKSVEFNFNDTSIISRTTTSEPGLRFPFPSASPERGNVDTVRCDGESRDRQELAGPDRLHIQNQPVIQKTQATSPKTFDGDHARTHPTMMSPLGLGSVVDTAHSPSHEKELRQFICSISPDIHDTLMNNFWTHYNSELQSVQKTMFLEGLRTGDAKRYSAFLHICILAIGLRYVEKTNPTVQELIGDSSESFIHQKALWIARYEAEGCCDVPSIQALLLLGDLEFGVGKYNSGWMYAGLASRLCFDIGLHLGHFDSKLSEEELHMRHMVVWACIVYDEFWALFTGRPTKIKSSQLSLRKPTKLFELGRGLDAASTALTTEIYAALLELINLSVEMTDHIELETSGRDHSSYLVITYMYKELISWYENLPKTLTWTSENLHNAPSSFYSLHQQYHATIILLHRAFAFSEISAKEDKESLGSEEIKMLFEVPRKLCLKNAIRLTEILKSHEERYSVKTIFATAVQHAAAAATIFILILSSKEPRNDRHQLQLHLRYLTDFLKANTGTYDAARKLLAKLVRMASDAGWDLFASIADPQPRTQRHDSNCGDLSGSMGVGNDSMGSQHPPSTRLIAPMRRSCTNTQKQSDQYSGGMFPPKVGPRIVPQQHPSAQVDGGFIGNTDSILFANEREMLGLRIDKSSGTQHIQALPSWPANVNV